MEEIEGENSQLLEMHQNPGQSREDPNPAEAKAAAALNKMEIFKALEIVERDSVAIAESYASLFSSLRLALSEVTSTSVENMQCFNDIVGSIQESALDAATKGNRYINSCLRLSEELKGMESLALPLCSGLGCGPVTSASLSFRTSETGRTYTRLIPQVFFYVRLFTGLYVCFVYTIVAHNSFTRDTYFFNRRN